MDRIVFVSWRDERPVVTENYVNGGWGKRDSKYELIFVKKNETKTWLLWERDQLGDKCDKSSKIDHHF